MGHYNYSIPVAAKIMVPTNCQIIGEQVAVNFVAQYVAIAIVSPAKNTLNFSFRH